MKVPVRYLTRTDYQHKNTPAYVKNRKKKEPEQQKNTKHKLFQLQTYQDRYCSTGQGFLYSQVSWAWIRNPVRSVKVLVWIQVRCTVVWQVGLKGRFILDQIQMWRQKKNRIQLKKTTRLRPSNWTVYAKESQTDFKLTKDWQCLPVCGNNLECQLRFTFQSTNNIWDQT